MAHNSGLRVRKSAEGGPSHVRPASLMGRCENRDGGILCNIGQATKSMTSWGAPLFIPMSCGRDREGMTYSAVVIVTSSSATATTVGSFDWPPIGRSRVPWLVRNRLRRASLAESPYTICSAIVPADAIMWSTSASPSAGPDDAPQVFRSGGPLPASMVL